jgi:hypothetical protein
MLFVIVVYSIFAIAKIRNETDKIDKKVREAIEDTNTLQLYTNPKVLIF